MNPDDLQHQDNPQGGTSDTNSNGHDNSAEIKKSQQNAADLIRHKLDDLYKTEPSAKEEAIDALESSTPRSKHQQYMYDLTRSGQSLAEIQKDWHKYYASLSDKEKHEVWQEFYEENGQIGHAVPPNQISNIQSNPISDGRDSPETPHRKHSKSSTTDSRSVSDIKNKIVRHAGSGKKLKAKQHLQSVIFGLGMGSIVMLFLLFGFFNERFIAPFISPSKQVSSTPIIVDSGSSVATGPPKIIIPKINVEIPVIYDVPTIEESAVEKGLERGVVHYATTPSPGELGNAVIFGHSSNNIFNPGKYKFAFVLLSRLEKGDLFYLTKNGKRYAYKVFQRRVVEPTEVSVLGSAGKKASVTLITCDPPGTSLKRLVVVGEQISPNPSENKASKIKGTSGTPATLPSNSPSLWSRLFDWFGN